MSTRPSIAQKRATFRKMHESGCFAIPNPWDIGSARYLQQMGFKALATTSSGFAYSLGYPDNGITRDMALVHFTELVKETDVPVNADFEAGFAKDAKGVRESVALCVETGVAALSIEDSTGDKSKPLYALDDAVARMKAARAAIDASKQDVMLVGRAECYLVGVQDMGETTKRLRAYADAGADCLYAPGIRTKEDIAAVVKAAAPKPVNVLIGWPGDLTMRDLESLGVRRVSVGGAMARAAWGGFIRSAKALLDEGSFSGFTDAAPGGELNAIFSADAKTRA